MKSPHTHPLRRNDGFSLIELVVALVMIAVLSSMAVPSLSGYVDRTRTRRALDQVVGEIARARLLAVQRGTPAGVTLNADGTYVVKARDNAGAWSVVKSGDLRAEYPGIVLSGDIMDVEFSSRGFLMNPWGNSDRYIKVARNGVRDSIFVSPAGRVYRAF